MSIALAVLSVIFMLVTIFDEVDWQMEPDTVYERQRRSMVSLIRIMAWCIFLLYVNLLPFVEAANAA